MDRVKKPGGTHGRASTEGEVCALGKPSVGYVSMYPREVGRLWDSRDSGLTISKTGQGQCWSIPKFSSPGIKLEK